VSKAAAKGAVLVGCGSPKQTVIYFPWAMKLAEKINVFLDPSPVIGALLGFLDFRNHYVGRDEPCDIVAGTTP
jgi:hypothetical protein